MPEPVTEPRPQGGRIAENILYFARTLRAAGLPVGPGRVLEALNAVEAVGLGRRDDFYWTLHAVFEPPRPARSEEHTSELQSLMRISYAVFCLKKTTKKKQNATQIKNKK